MRVRGAARARRAVSTAHRLARLALAVREQTGKPVRSQIREIVVLRRGRLAALEYYDYRLFDDDRFTAEEKREYTGRRFQWAAYASVNDPGLVGSSGIRGSWNGMIDKVLFAAVMREAGVPCPRTLAVFDAAGGSYAGYACVGTRDELEQIVLRLAGVGFFAKPARAASGDGGVAVLGLEGDRVMLGDGRKVQVRDFVDELASRGRALIQERLLQHAVLRAAVGETIATVRVAVLRGAERSEIHRAVLRIPVGRNMTDNFHRGENGNLLGRVDPATGVVDRVYGGTGLEQRRVATHPDTAAPLEGLVLPDWPAALALVDRASRALAGMALQSWDLALTERGPLMIEVNDVSSQDVLQLCGPPGMLDEHLCAFLRRRGFRWPYPHREADR